MNFLGGKKCSLLSTIKLLHRKITTHSMLKYRSRLIFFYNCRKVNRHLKLTKTHTQKFFQFPIVIGRRKQKWQSLSIH